jgi:hypothetical protein
MKKPISKPEEMCLALWVHTYLSPQTERRLCCASREPAQSFKQYIDTDEGSGTYSPASLDEFWNSEYVRNIRLEMMAGKLPSACEVCDKKLLNTDVYRDYFWHLFKHKYDEVWESTDETGYTSMKPVSWDYRFSNLCNFKCRQCGDMLSSSWEAESRKHNRINWKNPQNSWLESDTRAAIKQFQETQVEQEFSAAVEEHRVEEVYWVGGEPLMYDQHWQYMQRIVELGDGPRVYARYNTNLSKIEYRGVHLFRDILSNIRDWQVCASLDGTGKIGEYIRTGLNYNEWLLNFKEGMQYQSVPNQMRIDYTITLPGLLDAVNIFNLSKELDVQLLTKVTFTFSDDVAMSPLLLPRDVLSAVIDDILLQCKNPTWKQQSLIDTLVSLKTRPTTEEMFPDTFKQGRERAKLKIQQLETIRGDKFTFADIISDNRLIKEWWHDIASNKSYIAKC